MNKGCYLIVLCLYLGFLSCSSTKTIKDKSSTNYSFKKDSSNIYFTILQLNDVYEIAPIQGGKYGGLARVETLHKELIKEDPNTLLVLAGDFLNPSLLGTLKVEGERVRGRQMIEVMNAMNFDLVAFGNHEFDLSYEQLQNRLNESNFEWISANVSHVKQGKNHYFHKVTNGKKHPVNDSYIQNLNSNNTQFKIGFVSVCIPSNPRSYVSYGDVFIEAERSYNTIKNEVDVVLGLTHLAIEDDRKLAKLLPNVPILMGGHEHTNSYETLGDVKIAKADANAKTVYIHRFEYNPQTKKTRVKSELKTIDKSIPPDDTINSIVEKWQHILANNIKNIISKPEEIILKTKVPLEARDTPTRSRQTNMGDIIAKAMSFSYDNTVDCAFVNGGSIRLDDILVGKISALDIFRVLPYGGQVYKVKVKGRLLKEVLDFGENSKGKGAYLQHYNIKKQGENWMIGGQYLKLDKIYTIATTDYLLKGFDIPVLKESNLDVLNVYKPKANELSFDIRKAVIQFLKK